MKSLAIYNLETISEKELKELNGGLINDGGCTELRDKWGRPILPTDIWGPVFPEYYF